MFLAQLVPWFPASPGNSFTFFERNLILLPLATDLLRIQLCIGKESMGNESIVQPNLLLFRKMSKVSWYQELKTHEANRSKELSLNNTKFHFLHLKSWYLHRCTMLSLDLYLNEVTAFRLPKMESARWLFLIHDLLLVSAWLKVLLTGPHYPLHSESWLLVLTVRISVEVNRILFLPKWAFFVRNGGKWLLNLQHAQAGQKTEMLFNRPASTSYLNR